MLSDIVQQSTPIHNIPGAEGKRVYMQLRVDVRSLSNIEFVTQFATDLHPGYTQFYTDSIGLQLMQRAEYFGDNEPEKDYYPMPTALVLEESGTRRLSVLSNLLHGARFTKDPGFEILLDRRLSADDGKGLDDVPVDNLPVNTGFTFILDKLTSEKPTEQRTHYAYNTLNAHLALQSLLYQPVVFIAEGTVQQGPLPQNIPSFPYDIQLISVRPIAVDPNSRLLILHRAGIDCSTASIPSCEAVPLNVAVKSFLQTLGAVTSQKTLLSGTRTNGREMNYLAEDFSITLVDFTT